MYHVKVWTAVREQVRVCSLSYEKGCVRTPDRWHVVDVIVNGLAMTTYLYLRAHQ